MRGCPVTGDPTLTPRAARPYLRNLSAEQAIPITVAPVVGVPVRSVWTARCVRLDTRRELPDDVIKRVLRATPTMAKLAGEEPTRWACLA